MASKWFSYFFCFFLLKTAQFKLIKAIEIKKQKSQSCTQKYIYWKETTNKKPRERNIIKIFFNVWNDDGAKQYIIWSIFVLEVE